MTTSIKITSLTNIGGNIAYTTLVPVVNMAGSPETQKANLQIVGNLILSGAGGSFFPPASQATIALSVANASQPNITSVGTLTGLAVSGNILGGNANLGNLVISNFFQGNGNLLTNVNVSNGTSNLAIPVVNGNVNISVAGNANVLTVTGSGANVVGNLGVTGNVQATYFIGDGSQLTGLISLQGTTGAQGAQGIQGLQGIQGTTGSTGIQGTTGSTGIQGTNGILGTQGTQGISGITGNTVQWVTAPISNVSLGNAGEAAYDIGGNLFVCVATNTWAKFVGTTSW